ncbi:MAG: energy-coupled thiamine transporter ThiT [Clostridia bacterium]|nr:energy-coupled thiamine transporter ThiT [Clostridia bacterium]
MFSLIAGALAEGTIESTVESTVESAAETVAKTGPTWMQSAVEKFTETPATVWIAVAAIAVLGVMLLSARKLTKAWSARMLAFGALAIALSFVLSCIRLAKMPTHGSVTPGSMLPLMLFAAVYGIVPGVFAGSVYGLLQYFQDPWFFSTPEFILDWILAFAALGLAGIAKGKKESWLFPGIVLAVLGRAVCAIAAGLLIVADYAPGDLVINGVQMGSKFAFSAVYNGVYLLPELGICLLLAVLVGPRLLRELKRSK